MDDTNFGDDRSDELCRGDVKGRIVDLYVQRCSSFAKSSGDFFGFSLFDGNIGPIDDRKVEGARRCRDKERNLMVTSQNGQSISPDFVGRVPASRDSVGSDDHILDSPFSHDLSGHRVADERAGNPVLLEFPHRESGSLQKRPRLIGIHLNLLALVMGR